MRGLGRVVTFGRQLWALAAPYWRSEDKARAWGLFGLLTALTLGNVYLMVRLNDWRNAFYSALQNYDGAALLVEFGRFLVLAAASLIAALYIYYLRQILSLRWRRWLTASCLDDWLSGQAFYRLQLFEESLDNPDQRLSEDIRLFVDHGLTFSLGLLNAGVTLGSFVFILWGLSGTLRFRLPGLTEVVLPGYIVWAAFLYAAAGTWLAHRLGWRLAGLNAEQQRREADFRFSLARARANAESVALYDGSVQEGAALKKRLTGLLENFGRIIRVEKRLVALNAAYFQLANVFPVIISLPRYMAREINLGGLMQTAQAFGRVQQALSYLIQFYASLAEWRAVMGRLDGFKAKVQANRGRPSSALSVTEGHGHIRAVNLNLNLPDGSGLLRGLNFTFTPGQNQLIQGVNGCGKSLLFRTLAGLWPFAEGALEIPARADMFFIPQRAYLPQGSLKKALLYPGPPDLSSNAECRRWLEECGLDRLADSLELEADWTQVLSPGEQQRLALARALAHRPSWLFLDESSAAMDEKAEAELYTRLAANLPGATLISIGHRRGLERFHHRITRLAPAETPASRSAGFRLR